MILAELHGKAPGEATRWEDPLTSNVFGALKYLDRRQGLRTLLRLMSIPCDFSVEEVENARFIFWETRRSKDGGLRREPDVIIEVGAVTIFVEAKYHSPLDLKQLEDQYKIGSEYEDFYLLCVTDGFAEPPDLDAFRSAHEIPEGRLVWTSWQFLGQSFEDLLCSSSDIDRASRRLLEDVVELLEKKGLTRFRGFGGKGLRPKEIEASYETMHKFMKQVSTFSKELEKELQGTDIKLGLAEGMVERDGTSRSDSWEDWVTSEIGPIFIDKRWQPYKTGSHYAYLFTTFNMEDAKLYVGYGFQVTEEVITSLERHLSGIVKQEGREVYIDFLTASEETRWRVKLDELSEDFFRSHDISNTRWVEIYIICSLDEGNLVGKARKHLVFFRDLAEETGMVPQEARVGR